MSFRWMRRPLRRCAGRPRPLCRCAGRPRPLRRCARRTFTWASRLRMCSNARQILVLGDPFCKIMSLFRPAQFSRLLRNNRMVRYLGHVLLPQSVEHHAPAYHIVAYVKRARFEKYA